MRYDPTKNRVCLSADELVRLAQGELRYGRPQNDESRVGHREGGGTTDAFLCEQNGLRYEISVCMHETQKGAVTLRYRLPRGIAQPTAEVLRQARGEAFAAAHVLAQKTNAGRVQIAVEYLGEGGETRREETVTAAELSRFFARLLTALVAYHSVELDRVCRRRPTMAGVRYPFPTLREGQEAFISEAHRAMCRGERLFACAPTGIGKTMSVLFPAVRALGEGVFDKVFYFTPKTTVGEAAKDAIAKLARAGADVRAVEILAKERVCLAGMACRADEAQRCPYSKNAPERETKAALELLASGRPTVTAEDIKAAASAARVCPYELSLRYAELCDIVICDYNYLFDLRVYFKRFFSQKGRWCFLVDEAHNLVDRARGAYSLTLTPADLYEMGEKAAFLPQLQALFVQAAKGLEVMVRRKVADSLVKDKQGVPEGFASENAEPIALERVICRLAEVCTDAQNDKEKPIPPASRRDLADITYRLYHICDLLALYDERYVTFFRQKGDAVSFEMLCLDPSATLADRLSLGHAAVLFSATLRPCDYYRDVLGGRREDPLLDLPSPFSPEHLCVTVMDRVQVGYSSREASLMQVVRAILVTVKAKPGNYMVFCPSFAYQQAVCERLKKAVPGLCVKEQTPHMTEKERADFLAAFSEQNKKALIGFCVMGGIYGEGIDLIGRRLIGAVVVGVGLPTLSDEREAMRAYFEGKYEAGHAYAYVYPGMNRVMQAAGRVIRTETDKGVVVLIDERFGSPEYRPLFPPFWHTLKFAGDTDALAARLRAFWQQPTL